MNLRPRALPVVSVDEDAFCEDQGESALESVRVASVLGILAFVTFAFVDTFIAPGQLQLLFEVRAGVIAVLLGVLAATFLSGPTILARGWVVPLSTFVCVWIGVGVISVTALVGGAASTYHEALLLTFFGFAALPLPWRGYHAAVTFGSLVLAYDFVMLAFGLKGSTPQWLTANAVLWFAVVVGSAITWHAGNLRRQEFLTRNQLADANFKLQALDSAKTAFFTNMSHELRTPLTLVLAPLESMAEEPGALTPSQDEQLALARRSALRLLRLVDDLLVLSRIEGSALRLYKSSFDIEALARKLTEEAATLAKRKRIDVRFEAPKAADDEPALRIRGDEEQIERVVLNLLANALKFTPVNGVVVVSVVRAGANVEVSVSDTGPGIPAAERERVFDRFHQAEGGVGRGLGGTGIGLSLARELVNLHEGQIVAEATNTGGTLIRFTLPIGVGAAGDELPIRQEVNIGLPEWHEQIRRGDEYRLLGLDDATERRMGRRQQRDSSRATVLVIEDNTDMVRFLAGVLSSSYTVVAAADGQTGLRLAHERRPDLIVTDLTMPGISGLELLTQLREDAMTRGIPIVLLTARSSVEERMQGQALGADAYLTKPFQVAELLMVLRGLLRNHDDRETMRAAWSDEELDAIVVGVLQTVGRPANRVLSDASDTASVALLQQALVALADLVPDAPGNPKEVAVACDCNALAREAVAALGAAGSRVDLDVSARRTVHVVPRRVVRALVEVLDNALRASPSGRSVSLAVVDEGEATVRFVVRDEGPGVLASARDHIFQAFYSSTGRPGLGLTLARRLIRSQGGSFALDGEDRPFGASFSIRLSGVASAGRPA